MDEEFLREYTHEVCRRIEERYGVSPNFIEFQALIRRFLKYNPDADPENIDWVSMFETDLEFSEYVEKLKKAYPMYRWDEEGYDEDRYFSELYNYLVSQARELPESLRRRLICELQAEFGFEAPPELKPKHVEITPQVEKAIINLEFFVKYPFIEEARKFVKSIMQNSLKDEDFELATRNIVEAVRRGEISRKTDDPIRELMSRVAANMMLVYYNVDWLKRRYALAEAIRLEKTLHLESDAVFQLLLKKLPLNIRECDEEYEKKYGDFKMPFIEYLKAAGPLLTEPRWKLVNHTLNRGWIYLNKAEVVRLIRAYYQKSILKILYENSPRNVPENVRKIAETQRSRIAEAMQQVYNIYKSVERTTSIPPCIKNIMVKIETGEEATHIENFTLASYLLNTGKSVDEVLELFKNRSDYNEKIARYQVEHIAGLRGSRTRYRPPTCEKLKTLGICVEAGRNCPRNIKNPLNYYEVKKTESR